MINSLIGDVYGQHQAVSFLWSEVAFTDSFCSLVGIQVSPRKFLVIAEATSSNQQLSVGLQLSRSHRRLQTFKLEPVRPPC
jgi:hypothetical protein